MTELHKYRCETCKYFGNPPPNLRYWYGYCDLIDNKQNSRDLTEEEIKIHNLMGCASHSGVVEDFVFLGGKMEVVNRQDEREKVLDKAIAKIYNRINHIMEVYRGEENKKITERPFSMADGMQESIFMLKEIRQKGKREQECIGECDDVNDCYYCPIKREE